MKKFCYTWPLLESEFVANDKRWKEPGFGMLHCIYFSQISCFKCICIMTSTLNLEGQSQFLFSMVDYVDISFSQTYRQAHSCKDRLTRVSYTAVMNFHNFCFSVSKVSDKMTRINQAWNYS